ncbi:hypothetical protein E3N88_31454 [Mikania micrantha]|uniref:Uncharacterized protein n=1 Tax=Mikania micrantha TaxID=192012 RepID=A0A5N6MPM7_9ASTR|nr:hypothetical protein E3N88_31454 [Mikania micrantha]
MDGRTEMIAEKKRGIDLEGGNIEIERITLAIEEDDTWDAADSLTHRQHPVDAWKSHRCTTSTIVCVHRRKSHLVFLAFIFLFSSYRRRTPPHLVVASVPPPPTSDPVGRIKLKHRRNPVYASVTQFSSPVPPVSLAHMRRSKASVTQFSSPVPPVCSSLTVT